MEEMSGLVALPTQEHLTHTWLQQVLRHGLDTNLNLKSWTVKSPEKREGFASDISFVRVSYTTSTDAESEEERQLVVKFMPERKELADFVKNGNLGLREVEFYKYATSEEFKLFCLNSGMQNLIPLVYWAGINDDKVTVVLKDLTYSNYKSLTPPEGISLSQVKMILSALATVHAAGFYSINKHGTHKLDMTWDAKFMQYLVEIGINRLIEMYTDTPVAGILKTFLPQLENLIHVDESQPFLRTLIHGDLWTGNVMFNDDGNSVSILDWQFAHLGNPMCDILILLFLSCSPCVYEDHLTEVLEWYWESFQQALERNGVVSELSFTFQDLMRNVEDLWLFGFMFFSAAFPDLVDTNKMSEARLRSIVSFLEKRGVFDKPVPSISQNSIITEEPLELPPLRSDKEIGRRWLEEMLERKVGCQVQVKSWSVRLPEGREGFLSEIAFVEVQYVRQGTGQEGSGVEEKNKQDDCIKEGDMNEVSQNYVKKENGNEEKNKDKAVSSEKKSQMMVKGDWEEEEARRKEKCSLVFKFLPHDAGVLKFLASGGLAEREVEFYKFVSSSKFIETHVEVPVPEVYYAGYTKDAITLILRDLNQDKYGSVIIRDGSSLDQTKTALRAIAVVHAAGRLYLHQHGKQSGLATLAAEFKTDFYDQFFLPNLKTLTDMFEGTSLAKVFRALIPLTKEIRATSRRHPFLETVVHGDLWAGQMLYSHDQGAASIIDWQFCHLDNPVGDVMAMFFMSTDPQVLENHLPEILEDYWETFCRVLEAGGGYTVENGKVKNMAARDKGRNSKEQAGEMSSNMGEGETGLEDLVANVEKMWMYGFMFLAVSIHDFMGGDNISKDRLHGAMTFLEKRGIFSQFLAEFGDGWPEDNNSGDT